MSDLTQYHPLTQNYDLVKEFFSPSKKDQSFYELLSPDFGSILTALIRNGANFNSRKGPQKFDHVTYFVHFFLAMVCVGHESRLKNELGLKNTFWHFDKENGQLKFFTTQILDSRKILTLNSVNFKPENQLNKHQWSDMDLRNLFFFMEKNLASYTINSHWYEVYAENLEGQHMEQVLVPSFVFTSDVKVDVKINTNLAENKSKRKFKKSFHRIDTDDKRIAETKEILKNLASEDKTKMARSFDKLLDKIVKLQKKNLFGSLGEEMQSLKSVFQCAFAHGALLALKKRLPVKINVDQIKVSNPGYRIRMTWTLRKSWKDVMTRWSMQVEIIPALDQLGERRETILDDVMASSIEMDAEMTAETFKDSTMVGYLNFNADRANKRVLETKVVPPWADTLNFARNFGAITLRDKIVEKLNTLKVFLDSSLSYALSTHSPTYKVEKSRYLSNYLHGYIASSDFSSQANSIAYKIEPKNPTDLEKLTMTSFMVSTIDETVDLIFNVYESDVFLPQDYAQISEFSYARKYPRTGEKVTLSVIYDFFLAFSSVKKQEFKNHMVPNSLCYMKSISKDGETTFNAKKIEHLDLVEQFAKYDGNARDKRQEDREILMRIRKYFDENFQHVKDQHQLKAVIDGLLYKVKIIPNVIGMRKNVFQTAFLDEQGEKLNLLNFAYGENGQVIEGLDDVKDLIDSDVLKDKDKVKSMNLAVIEESKSEKKTLTSRNDFLTVLAVCHKMSKIRSKRDAKCTMDDEVEKFLPKTKEKFVKVKTAKYLENLSKLSSGIMFGLMAKDFVSDLIHGNIAGMAINAGFIISNVLAGKLAQKLLTRSATLAQEERILLANILKIGGPFLQRLPSFAFVGFDLYNNILQYKHNNSETLVNIAVDGTYLALDVAETAVEVAETFGLIEGVSAVTGPIGWTMGATLLVGSDIYRSVKNVEHLNDMVHLIKMERFTEGLRSFFGLDPEKHIEKLINEKTALQMAVKENMDFLVQHDSIIQYIFPVKLGKNSDITTIDLQNKRRFQKSRSIPDSSNYACIPPLEDEHPAGIFEGYVCTDSLGLQNVNKSGNLVYIQIASGQTRVYGHLSYANVYDVIGAGNKSISGTTKDDTLIIRNKDLKGVFLGSGGVNTVDVSKLNYSGRVFFSEDHVSWAKKRGFFYSNVSAIVGRGDVTEKVMAWCQLNHIELHGSNEADHITIPEANCSYNMTVLISGNNTSLINKANKGVFTYLVSDINNLLLRSSANENQTIVFGYASSDIQYISIKHSTDYSLIHVKFTQNAFALLEVNTPFPPLIYFKDGATLLVNGKRATLNVTTSLSIDRAVGLYSIVAIKSKISCIVHSSTENITATLNSHHMRKGNGIRAVDVAFSATTGYALRSLSHELVFVVQKMRNSVIHIKHNQKVIIDLNTLLQRENAVFHAQILESDVIIDIISTSNQSKNCQLTLKHAMKNHSYENIVIRKQATYILRVANGSISLVSIPLQFDEKQNMILLNSRDGLELGSEVHFAVNLSQYDFFNMNDVDLMLTNVLHTDALTEFVRDQFAIILKDFFVDEVMQSLKLVFMDLELDFAIVERSIFKPVDYLLTVLNAKMLTDL